MNKNYFGITDTGKIRDNNEDTFIAEQTASNNLVIACVIDGVGGYSGGEIASDLAKKSILHHLSHPNGELPSLMKNAILAADDLIMAEKQKVKAHENMACVLTLAVIDLNNNQFYYAHVGDTRLYLLRDNSLIKISKDQSFVGFMEDTGRLTEEQAMRHPKRNEINKALGFGAKIAAQEDYIEMGQSPFLPGDMLLLCSDGLSDMVNKQEITDILIRHSSLQEKGTQLINIANKNGGLDNITAVLVKNNNQTATHEATKPAAKTSNVITPPASKNNPLPPAMEHENTVQKNSKGVITILSILCFIFLSATLYLLWLHQNKVNNITQYKFGNAVISGNASEMELQDTINKLEGNTLIITDSLFKLPITITESLHFNKDTLFIIAKNHFVLKSDSAFRGNAILIQPGTKYIFLENITFQDFNTAISSQDNTLILKNVQFINSPNAIQSIYHLPQKADINGKIQRSTFKADSLSKTIK